MKRQGRTRRGAVMAGSIVLLVATAVPVAAASWKAKLLAADRVNADFFGESVAISGDTVVVGARFQNAGGFDRGAAYVFVRTGAGWLQQAKLTAVDGANSDQFGTAVAISGDTVVVGAPMDDDRGTSSGSAYVFTRSDDRWTQTAKVVAPDGVPGDEFGSSVAVAGDTALVGARRHDKRALDAGAVYVFRNDGGAWVQDAALVAADGQSGDVFGHAVSISADTALVGAYGDDDRGTEAGAAYVFTRDAGGWTQHAKFVAPDGAAGDLFGFAVSLSTQTAVVSAFADDDGARDAGSVYVLRRADGAWDHDAKLRPADPQESGVFGRAAAVDGNAAIVGASMDDTVGMNAGAVYVFERRGGQWQQTAKLTAPDGTATDLLGYGVAIDGGTGVVGAPLDDDRATDNGSAHVFTGLADVTPPLISADVDPRPNNAGWHNAGPVTVTFACTDAGSGIASCTDAVAVPAEPGTIVTGTAVDQAGNTASLDVEVRLDATPPRVSVHDPSPIPGAPVPASTLSGTATDALSGVEQVAVVFTNVLTSAEETRIATRTGDTWTVRAGGLAPGPTRAAVTATDIAGNVAPAATVVFLAAP